jgi:hypothetical protein
VVGKVSLACLAAVDALAVEVNVVCQAHVAVSWAAAWFEPYVGRAVKRTLRVVIMSRAVGEGCCLRWTELKKVASRNSKGTCAYESKALVVHGLQRRIAELDGSEDGGFEVLDCYKL